MAPENSNVWNGIMNGIKNLALILVVVGVGYLVYQHLYGPARTPSPETGPGPEMPPLEIPGLNRPGQAKPSTASGQLASSLGASAAGESAGKPKPGTPTGVGSPLPDPDQRKPTSANPSSKSLPAKPQAKDSPGGTGSGNAGSSAAAKPTSSDPVVKDALVGAGSPKETGSPQPDSSPKGGPSAKAEAAGATDSAKRRPEHEIGEQFITCMQVAHQALQQGQWTEVLMQLSPWYRYPDLTRAESDKLTELLDQLAGSVIYSREHRLEAPYRVRPGDDLVQIARQYQVSWELLAKINGIRDPYQLEGIDVLKVVRGPFHALVDLTRRDITLMLEFRDPKGQIYPLYAGRFPIRAISGISELEGQYEVLRKAAGPRARQPGPLALELSQQVIIHGPADPQTLPKARGTLELPEADMEDIYDILTIGSRVLIRR